MSIVVILIVLAAISFGLAAFTVPTGRYNSVAGGYCFLILALLASTSHLTLG